MRVLLILCFSVVISADSNGIGQSSNIPCEISSAITTFSQLVNDNLGGCPKGDPAQYVKFYLSNRLFPDYNQIYLDDPTNLEKYDSTKPTVFLVHGWLQRYNAPWLIYLKDSWLQNVDCNIISVDWSCLAKNYFTASTLNIAIVGEQIGALMIDLQTAGYLQINTVTCFGHSLGAHSCGMAGKYVIAATGTKPAVIYASDPAGPCITQPNKNPDDFRLIATDATYVEVYHCTFGTVGVNLDCGVVDIYFNLGILPQCGCNPLSPVEVDSITKCPGFCDHENCNLYFIYSLFIQNPFIAKKLNAFSLAFYTTNAFSLNQCPSELGLSTFKALTSTSLVIGIYGNHQQTGRFYCPTTYNPPHCPNCPLLTYPNYFTGGTLCGPV